MHYNVIITELLKKVGRILTGYLKNCVHVDLLNYTDDTTSYLYIDTLVLIFKMNRDLIRGYNNK